MFHSNNFIDTDFGHPFAENNSFGFNGHPLGAANDESSNAAQIVPDFDPMAGFGNWHSSEHDLSQYLGSTILGTQGFTDPIDVWNGPAGNSNTFDNYDHGLGASSFWTQLSINPPDHAGPSPTGPSTVQLSLTDPTIPFPATSSGFALTPSQAPTFSCDYSASTSAPYPASENQPSWVQGLLPAGSTFANQWSNVLSVNLGEPRATNHFPSVYPAPNAMWQCQQPHLTQNHNAGGLYPQMGIGAPNTDIFSQVAPSFGPLRSIRDTKGKGRKTGKGTRKRHPTETLDPGITWSRTLDRFERKMLEVYFDQPSGGLTKPEMAYAKINNFVKEDLHQSPLAIKPLGVRRSREFEDYLIGVLNMFHRPRDKGRKSIRFMLAQIADEIERNLNPVNNGVALRDGHPSKTKCKLDNSEEGVKHRKAEQARRTHIREALKRMSLYFQVQEQDSFWTGPQVLFFAATYLMFGAEAFDDGFVKPA